MSTSSTGVPGEFPPGGEDVQEGEEEQDDPDDEAIADGAPDTFFTTERLVTRQVAARIEEYMLYNIESVSHTEEYFIPTQSKVSTVRTQIHEYVSVRIYYTR
jgi:hypothetical protein